MTNKYNAASDGPHLKFTVGATQSQSLLPAPIKAAGLCTQFASRFLDGAQSGVDVDCDHVAILGYN